MLFCPAVQVAEDAGRPEVWSAVPISGSPELGAGAAPCLHLDLEP